MKKKLVAITSVVLVSVGATMTIAAQSQNQPTIHINQTQGLSDLPTIESKEIIKEANTFDENPPISSDIEVIQESNEMQTSHQELNGKKDNDLVIEKSSESVQNTLTSSQTSSLPESKPTVTPTAEESYLSIVEQLIYQKVNEERQKAGLSPLSYNQTMQKYARSKSADMGERGYFSHENPEGQLITTYMQQDGVSYSAWGENIAYIGGVSEAESLANQFMTNWMNSEGHRANILSSNFSSIGVGVYEVNGKVYATQEFYR